MVRSGSGVLLLPHALGALGESAELFNGGFEVFCDLGGDDAGAGRLSVSSRLSSRS